jgi:hypothetical protein
MPLFVAVSNKVRVNLTKLDITLCHKHADAKNVSLSLNKRNIGLYRAN